MDILPFVRHCQPSEQSRRTQKQGFNMSQRFLNMTTLGKVVAPIICAYLFLQVCSGRKPEGKLETNLARESKNLFPFVWVTFQPSPCGANNDGVCVQRGKCTKKGGTSNGNCQDSFGDCCMFTAECNANSTVVDVPHLVTTLNDPTPIDTQCTFRFRKEPNICQIRLDFETFDLAGADTNGVCDTDRLRITNTITIPPEFSTCGNLADQHMYLTFGSQDSIEVTPIIKRTSSKYKIVATRIPCDSKNRAPDYCLQYFTKPTDRVRSFDFGGQQQNNQMYTVCVKPMSSSQQIQWKPCAIMTGNSFNIVSNVEAVPHPCNTDWIQVKGLPKVCEPFAELVSPWKPYELLVNFDKNEFPDPPPFFTMPVNPANCDAACISQPPAYECSCTEITGPTNQACTCVVTNGVTPQIDFNNTGFCLDYTQM